MFKFLNIEPEVFGLDINDSSFKIMKLKKSLGSLKPVSTNEKIIPQGVISGGIIRDEQAFIKYLKSALEGVKGRKLDTKYVVASLPEEKSFSQVIQMPLMDAEELKTAVIYEAANYIPLHPDEMYLDYQVVEPIVNHLDHLDVFINAVEKTLVDSYVDCLKKAGLIPAALEVETQAIARALVKNETTSFPTAIIDMGSDRTDLIVFAGHSVRFTCSIPVSAQQLTDEIAKALNVDQKTAEQMKHKYGILPPESGGSAQISGAITPILEGILQEVDRYFDFYLSHDTHLHLKNGDSAKIQKIILSGGGGMLKGLPKFFTEKTGISTELGNPWINFSPKLKIEKIKEMQGFHLSLATAIGLSMREAEKEI